MLKTSFMGKQDNSDRPNGEEQHSVTYVCGGHESNNETTTDCDWSYTAEASDEEIALLEAQEKAEKHKRAHPEHHTVEQ